MDLRICDKCKQFSCSIATCTSAVYGDDILITNYVLVVKCGRKVVAARPIGPAKAEAFAYGLAVLQSGKSKHIPQSELPDDIASELDMAMELVTADCLNMDDFRKCPYLTEQTVSNLNQ